jgi:glutamine amidotransferase
MITIVNYGSGNIQAIGNIYKNLNIEYSVANSPELLESAEKLILPGVGAFDKTMQQLIDSGLKKKLDELVLQKRIPVLGICVGMQILAEESEEGTMPGLGWIGGKVKKIDTSQFRQKTHLPHMGWNSINPFIDHPLLDQVNHQIGFYFLHSYFFSCAHEENILCTTNYGNAFPSGIYSQNIFGLQFHPEKSHSNGIQVLRNFSNL